MEILKDDEMVDFSLLFTRFYHSKDRDKKFDLSLEILLYDFGPEETMLEAMKSHEYLLALKYALRRGKNEWLRKGDTDTAYQECKNYMKIVKKQFPEVYKSLKI